MSILVWSSIIVFVMFTLIYILAAIIKNASILDIGWGLGFVVLAWVGFFMGITIVSTIFLLLITLWGLRLTYHIFRRNYKKPEDFRYAKFRKDWGKTYYVRSYFQLFLFQGLLMYIIALPYILGQKMEKIISVPWLIIGVFVWLIGFTFESIGDLQLKRFVKDINNKGKVMDVGLWRYSRHPNYFGEALLWWGIYIMALSCGAPIYSIIGPLTITLIIRYVSGVPMLERNLIKRKGFEEYKQRTNIFVPWFQKKKL